MTADNLSSVRERIANACLKAGVNPDSVLLVAVTKEAGISQIEEALRLGLKDMGENRAQDLVTKYRYIGDKANWHFIGHLQTNKVRDVVRIASLIHSVDSLKLAKEIDAQAAKIGKIQKVLIQVNTSGENTKFGVHPDEAIGLIKEASSYGSVEVEGLMTMAPEAEDPELARPYFRRLRELRDKINSLGITCKMLHALSMGMTNDFEVAIEEGSDILRIGRAIFK